jgi:hypothetical protein
MPSLKPRHPKPAEPSAPKPEEQKPARPAEHTAADTRPAHEPESLGQEPDDDPDTSQDQEMEMRVNPRIEKEIADYKAAYPRAVEYFTKLVKEHPDRAVNFHFREKQKQHAIDTKRAMRQMPQAQALYEKMTPDSRARVDERLATANKYSHAKRFVWSVRRELNRASASETSRIMNMPVAKIAPTAPVSDAPRLENAPPPAGAPRVGVA